MSENEIVLIKQINDFHKEFRETTAGQLRRLEDGQKNLLDKIENLAKTSEIHSLDIRVKTLEEFKWKIIGIVTVAEFIFSAIILLILK